MISLWFYEWPVRLEYECTVATALLLTDYMNQICSMEEFVNVHHFVWCATTNAFHVRFLHLKFGCDLLIIPQ